ncbi:cytochrome P450 [Cerasicoccus frondis]|uniref:cytochrome P450 n=1 Tax=Cerasicoccus frondis TaxID=490090 RepID=UPI0028526E9A|nr:cytochrome P450 [Cerasicoccus frondis]
MSLFKRIFGQKTAPVEPSPEKPAPAVFHPASPEFIADPYPFLQALRESAPLLRSDSGPWVLTRLNDITAALSDKRLSNAPASYAIINGKNRERYTCADVANNLIAFMDPPDHTAARKLLARAFHQYMREGLPDLNAIAASIAQELPHNEPFDLIERFATPFSLEVILQIFGLPSADADKLKAWTDHFFYLFTQIPSVEIREAVDRTLVEFRAYFDAEIAARKSTPGSDFLSLLVQANEAAGEAAITDRELVDNCLLIFADGIENVDSGIANAVVCLLKHGNAWSQLSQDAAEIGPAVDECLRFESPAQFIGRVALEDFELHGQTIRQGNAILLVLASANRDAERFPEPNRFDIQRSPNPYLSFGRGKHSCLGGSLVKLQMEASLQALVQAAPNLTICDATLDWQYRLGHRWLKSLTVRQ